MGGRSSYSGLTVTIFGASGYIGRLLANRLGRSGTKIVIPYRCDDYDIAPMKIMGDLGMVNLQRFHLRNYQSIVDCVKYSDVVVNLIAQDRRTFNFNIENVNVGGAMDIAQACKEARVERLIHGSCLRAKPDALSEYSRTKAEGEARVRDIYPDAIIVRPATVFGTQDRLINGIGQFTRSLFGFPIIGDGQQIKVPIHVSNVVDAFQLLIREKGVEGKIFELVGPKAYTYKRLVELFAYAAVVKGSLAKTNPLLFWLYGRVSAEIRRTPFPYDTILQIAESERPSGNLPGMADLGFGKLERIEDHMVELCRRYRKTEVFGLPIEFPPELLADSTGAESIQRQASKGSIN